MVGSNYRSLQPFTFTTLSPPPHHHPLAPAATPPLQNVPALTFAEYDFDAVHNGVAALKPEGEARNKFLYSHGQAWNYISAGICGIGKTMEGEPCVKHIVKVGSEPGEQGWAFGALICDVGSGVD